MTDDPVENEPMYLIRESELALFSENCYSRNCLISKLANTIRARGPAAQQVPTSDICMDCDGEPAKCKNDPSKCQHDPVDIAALIAQEREKWESERDAEQRITDVIRELEEQISDAKKNKNYERVVGYEKAIALLGKKEVV